MSTHTRIEILLEGDWASNDGRNEKLSDDLIEWLHERVCGRDHGPTGEEGECAEDFSLSGTVVRDDADASEEDSKEV